MLALPYLGPSVTFGRLDKAEAIESGSSFKSTFAQPVIGPAHIVIPTIASRRKRLLTFFSFVLIPIVSLKYL